MRLVGLTAAVFVAANTFLACGTVLNASDDAKVDAGADGASSEAAAADAPGVTDAGGDAGDAKVDAEGKSCRVAKTDGFEAADWTTSHPLWNDMFSGAGSFSTVPTPKTGKKAFEARVGATVGTAWISTAVSDSCLLTIDVWAQRAEGDTDLPILAIQAGVRTLSIVLRGTDVWVDSAAGPLDSLGEFTNNVYHHIVVTYVPAGTVVVTVDDRPSVTSSAGDDAGAFAAESVQLGIMPRSVDGSSRVLFDDVTIY